MNKKTLTKITSSALVMLLAVVMIFSVSADALNSFAYSEAGYIKQITGVDPNYKQYLNSAVMYELPSSVRDDQEISVIVMLENPALLDTFDATGGMTMLEYYGSDEANALREKILDEKTKLTLALDEKEVVYRVGAMYDTVLSGFEVVLEAKYFDELCDVLPKGALPIISEEFMKAETTSANGEVVNMVDVYETGIFNSSSFKYDGSGMVVAVLDTGLDYTHTAFSLSNFTSTNLGLTKAEVAAVLANTNAAEFIKGLVADDVYINDKVPFAFDYADVDSDVYNVHNNHGTHVSGIILGKDDVITGVAPNAQLVSMKIFSDIKDSAYTSWILNGLEDCVILGVDVINMSLGTACGFSRERDVELVSGVYDKIREKGISLVVAASNSYSSAHGSEKNGNLPLTSNPDVGTVGSPSTYEAAFSVASINGTKTPYINYNGSVVYFEEASNSASEEKHFVEEILPEGIDEMTFDYVVIPGAGRPADYMNIDVTGKVVLVRRGATTFEEKANAALEAGALGIIIYNNTSGDIRMNVGITSIPSCSISQDDGEKMAESGSGSFTVGRSQSAGPFMSDFSSWGPTPDLKIKPEITAHGGNILSAITGGEYDRLSGTSMACPNMAGVVALMRQYILENYPNQDQLKYDNGEYNYYEVNAVINRLLMSTATAAINKNGLPYSVRKQGSGLANLNNAANTTAYILTYENGVAMNKTKLELGDDANKSGVYTLNFSVYNFGTTALSYDISAIVMTEGVSDTLTHKGDTVVTQEGYILEGASVVAKGSTVSGNTVTVAAGATADITVTITLSDSDKKYMDDSFENGMYVEGFVQLTAKSGTDVNLSVPYLAFYGDWTQAPVLDLDYYVTNADEIDDSIDTLDKTLPDAFATRPVGSVENDYISYLGGYYFVQNPQDKLIGADRKYIALSNTEGTVHELYAIWAGMLRNAKYATITITDASTGEVIEEITEDMIRKSYGDGGSYIYPGQIDINFDIAEHNLKNNTQYNVVLKTYLDYGDGGENTNVNNTFEFPFVTDFEAPVLTDVEYYTEYDRNEKKNRLFMKMAVYDNHYSMAAHVGYIGVAPESSEYEHALFGFSPYLTPIYSEKDSTTYVTFELTDYLNDIKNGSLDESGKNSPNTFTVSLYDYALNFSLFEIPLPTEYIDLYFEETDITLNPNEVYSLNPLVYPTTEWPEMLEYASADNSVASVVNNKIIAKKSGSTTIIVYDKENPSLESVVLNVTVRKEGDEGYRKISKPVADVFELMGYETLKAYYQLAGEDRDLGETGHIRDFLGSNYSLSMFPSESVKLRHRAQLYFPDVTKVVYESGNSNIVTVDQNGVITAKQKGYASIYVKLEMDGKRTPYTLTVSIEVKDPYVRTGPWLTHYFGLGGVVDIPESLLFTEISQYAFSNYCYVLKDLEAGDVINEDDPGTTKIQYIGENTITEVIIPEGVEKIGPYAFANLTALTKVTLPSTLKYIEYGAFYGCRNLTTIVGLENVVTINKSAFEKCNLTGTISLDSARAISDYAFADNRNLKNVILSDTLQSVGAYTFYNNTKLESVTFNAEKVKLGDYAFMNCKKLYNVEINASVIPTGAFLGCTELKTITLGKDVNVISQYAFADTQLYSFNIAEGNSSFVASSDGTYLTNSEGDTILIIAPAFRGGFVCNDTKITTIATGAFSAVTNLTSVSIPSVTVVGDYAFADSTKLTKITLGKLESIGSYAFFNIPIKETPDISEVEHISPYAFAFTDLKSVSIGNDVTVGEGAFTECQSLATVVLGDNVTVENSAFMLYSDAKHDRTGKNNWKFSYSGKYYYFEYLSPLTSLTIGKNAVIGTNAFYGASKIKSITLGEGASIGECAFYNADSLVNIDLSKAIYIGNGAFSSDVSYYFASANSDTPVIVGNQYVLKFYTPDFTSINLSSLVDTEDRDALGMGAFEYCRELTTVVLGDGIKTIHDGTFFEAPSLTTINLDKVVKIGEGAFSTTALTSVDLSSATEIGAYAFVYCDSLESVILNKEGCTIGEGAFSYASNLKNIDLSCVTKIDAYALAYTGVEVIDLTSAVTVGDHAFMKNTETPVTLTLGENLESLGDNPFAFCVLAPMSKVVTETFGDNTYETLTYTFDLNDNIRIINGSIYCKVPAGLELTTYIPIDNAHATVDDDTVRITAFAFAGTDVQKVTLPHALRSIGHKAFYDCDSLVLVEFKSYEAPILEEEYDPEYYNSCDNLPGTGVYKLVYQDGTEVEKTGIGIVPFYIYDSYAYPSNVFYGANFVDYIGHHDPKLVMVKPSNGKNYETFIYGQYFSIVMDGGVAADQTTLNAIEAINRMPKPVQLKDEALVIAAREAYNLIAKTEQKALVYNYADLLTAEQRIAAFKNTGSTEEPDDPIIDEPTEETDAGKVVLIVFVILEAVIILAGAALACWYFFIYKKKTDATPEGETPDEIATEEVATAEDTTEEIATEEVATAEDTTEEIATEEVATAEDTTEEIATEEVATAEDTTEEIATEDNSEEDVSEESTEEATAQTETDSTERKED